MYTDVESSGKKLLEYDDTVRVGKQRFLFSHLQHSLFKNPLEQVLVSVAGGNAERRRLVAACLHSAG